uniref:Carbamoyl phosphate synthase small chain n=1 Tax=Lophosiphonia teges TaxID=2007110 RepID=A0A1Z1MVU0_9FLOR|nr:carbamoyl phosphate synthase small subunit [Polysiphonia teges]
MSYNLYPAVLYLQDSTLYKGWSFFKLSSSFGEIVFNTGMTGYQEILSDPSYAGQMIVFTYPEIGNTGFNNEDNESNFIHAKAIIAKRFSSVSSNWRSTISFRDYLISKRIPHIFGLDTRSITKHLTLFGVTNAVLLNLNSYLEMRFPMLKSLYNLDLVRKVTSKKMYNFLQLHSYDYDSYLLTKFRFIKHRKILKKLKVLVIDFGTKFSILRNLLYLGCDVFILPATSSYSDILKYKPDGILLSNGPGDPMMSSYAINTVKNLVNFANIPIFGICMGHQILNLSFDFTTFKLKFGHRGLNHPSGICSYSEITSQNHGFAVDKNSSMNNTVFCGLSDKYYNLNDLTLSCTYHKKLPIFSVQYHPESSPGPHDSQYLFETFLKIIQILNT